MFRSKGNAEEHARSAHKEVRYPCPDPKCPQVFTCKRYVATHVKRVHPTEEPEPLQFPCPVAKDYNCPQRFYTTTEAKRHARAVHRKDRIACPYEGCPATFSSTRSAETHAKSVHKGERHPCPIPQCGKVFTRKDYIEDHVKRVHKKENPRDYEVPCPDAKEFDCDECFWSIEEAKRHSRNAHKKDRLPCPHAEEENCPRTFDSVGHAKAHASSVHKKFRYPCPVPNCPKAYCKKAYLKEHMERAHPTEDAWPCPLAEKYDCPKIFSNKHRAIYHAKFHLPDRYICQYSKCLSHVQEKKMTLYRIQNHQRIHMKKGHFKEGECPPLHVSDSSRGD
jgi:uncharacterized Zn-finger protein